MVSSTPAPLVNPPVSYADRVKRTHSPRSPKLVRNSSLDFPAVPTASPVSSSVSPRSNATAHLPRPLNPVEFMARSQPGASDFPVLLTEMSSQSAAKDHNEPTNHVHANPQSVPKTAPVVNVWTERMKEQVALTHVHQAQKQPRTITTLSDGAPQVPPKSKPAVTGPPSHPLNIPNTASSASTSHSSPSQTTSLSGNDDEHDPFVVRFPPHLSRHSSSKSIPVVNENGDTESRKPPSPTDNDGPEKPRTSEGPTDAFNSSDLSRKNSNDTTQHQSDSKHPSARASRTNNRNIFDSNSASSRSVSHSGVESHTGSSSSSPGLQVRGRRLPEDELNVAYDPRPEVPKALYNPPPRMNLRVPERNSYYHPSFSHPPADIQPHHYRSPPMPPIVDSPIHPSHLSPLPPAIRHPYTLPIQHYTSPIPGHTSPTYMGSRPPSGAGTPPYTVYSPYQAPYGYSHSHVPWDIPPIHPRPGPGYSSSLLPQGEYNVSSPPHHSFLPPPFAGVTDLLPDTHVTQNAHSHERSHSQSGPARNMVFGSFGHPYDDVHQMADRKEAAADKEGVKESVEQVMDLCSGLTIGFAPGELTPGSRKRLTKSHSRPSASPIAESADNVNTINDAPQDGQNVTDERTSYGVAMPGKKWEFGTTARCDSVSEDSPPEELGNASLECPPPPVQPAARPPSQHPPVAVASTQLPRCTQPVTPSIDTSDVGPSILNSEDSSSASDVWEVKDYGYGFGDVSGTDNATDLIRRAREGQVEWQKGHVQKQQQDEHWQEGHDEAEIWGQGKEFGRGRPRRGSWANPYGPHERGGYGGRRSRGFGSRYQGRYHDRGHQQPPISLTPPPQFNPLPLPDHLNGYTQQMLPYSYPDYELYHPVIPVNGGPPIPMPQSALPFPLDATRSRLLGQLEYYLSSQNMAQDFFLRQRMDDEGWIPISLIASFNRVKQLTTEVQMVRDVLNLSSLTEVKGDYVRMASEQWKQFVLPTALRSNVCHQIKSEPTELHKVGQADAHAQGGEIEEGDTYAEDDEEEEDIVFVIGKEAEGSWAPERRPTVSEKN